MAQTVHHEKLANGVSLIVVPLANTEAITSIVFMGVGSRFESDAQQGLAHFTEHMVFKGGRKYKTTQDITRSLDSVGGEFNAFTSCEYTGFYTKTAAKHLDLSLDILSDMTLHATFPEEELAKEKGVIVEEINMYEDMPMRKVDQVHTTLLYGDTPLGRPILGTKKSVTSFTSQDFIDYRNQFYKGEKCVIVLAGAVKLEEARELATKYFSELPSGGGYQAKPGIIVPADNRVRIEEKASEQTHLILSTGGYSFTDPKYPIFRLLTIILGGSMSSRLFVSVREEQGLCYYVHASMGSFIDVGTLTASAGVDNNRLPQAVEAIMKELRHLRSGGISEEEINRAKQFVEGKMLLAMEDSEWQAEYYGLQQLLEGKMETPDDRLATLRAITAEELHQVAQEIFTDESLRLAVVGPHQNASTLDSSLTFNL